MKLFKKLIFTIFLLCKTCYSIEYFSRYKNIVDEKNNVLHLKGINYFGFETSCNIVHGLWKHNIDFYLDILHDNKFNFIRLPIAYESAINLETPINNHCVTEDKTFQDITVKEAIHIIFEKMKDRHMFMLLDIHTLNNIITEKPYGYDYNNKYHTDFSEGIINLIKEYNKHENLLGIDIKNEPHGDITFEEWESLVDLMIDKVETKVENFRGVYFVEGVQQPPSSAWGGSFSTLPDNSFLINNEKIVFSPHVYGFSVRGDIALKEGTDDWEHAFGYLSMYNNAIVIGEFGGRFDKLDKGYHYRLLDYLKYKKITSTAFWCLNPNSGDTHGLLLDDWTMINYDKLLFLEKLQTNPTIRIFK